MGFQSQIGQFGLKTQGPDGSTVGAYEDPGAAAPNDGIFLRHRSGSINANRELLTPDPEIGGDPDTPGAILGASSWTGEIEAYSRMEYLPTVIQALFGPGSAATTSTGTTQGVDQVGTHVLTPQDDGVLGRLSVEEAVSTLDTFRYYDAVMSNFSLEIEPNGYMMNTMGFLAPNQEAGIVRTATPDIDTTPLMVGTSMTVTIGGVAAAICVRSLNLEFNNNVEDDVFCLGKDGLTDLTPKRREFTISTTVRPVDNTLWREAVYGSAAATTPLTGAAATKDIQINVVTNQPVGTGVATPFSLVIDVPVTNIQPFEHEPSGDDVIEWDVEFLAVRPQQAVPLTTWTIVNDLAVIR